jgi:hypothetical protein
VARAPSFKTASLADLYRQLRYAPAETLERQMEAAETLAGEIEAHRAYPEEFIAFRITQYRPRAKNEPVMLVGAAILADLGTLVQSLSAVLTLPPDDEKRGRAIAVTDLAKDLGVATRTLRRYHRRGLLLHYVRFDEDTPRLACFARSLEMFRQREPSLLGRAGMYSRLSDEQEESLIAEAIRLHDSEGLSRQQISRQLAARDRRAVETIRSLLSRAEKARGGRLFKGTRRMTPRDEALVIRAWSRSIPIREIGARLGRSPLTVRRSLNQHRAARLREVSLSWIDLPTFSLPEAENVILSAPSVESGLAPSIREADGIALLVLVRGSPENPDRSATEEARLAGYNLLKRRAAQGIEALPDFPTDDELDRLERDLRWAAALKRSLVLAALGSAIVRVEQNLARPLHQQTSELIRRLLRIGIHQTAEAVESADPSREQIAGTMTPAIASTPVERIAAIAIDKELARQRIGRGASTAGVRHAAGSVPMGDPFADLCAWQGWIELPARLLARLDKVEEPAARMVIDLFGLTGNRPLTPREIAATHGLSLRAVNSRLTGVLRMLRRPPVSPGSKSRMGDEGARG